MKKVITKKRLLSTLMMLSAFCMLTPVAYAAVFSETMDVDQINAVGRSTTGRNVRHDTDTMLYDKYSREVDEDYVNYSRQMIDKRIRGTDGESTIIKGDPRLMRRTGTGTDTIQGQVEASDAANGVYVTSIEVAASEILSREEISNVISKYVNRNLYITDIQEMINELNALYDNRGFVTARAYLPEQQVSDGSIYVGLMESRIGQINVENNKWTKTNYVLNRLPEKEGELFDIVQLEKDVLDFNRYNEGVNLTANLKAGQKEGTTDIDLIANENFPFHIIGVMDNAGRKSTGSLRGGPMLVADSLFKMRDKMGTGVYFSKGAISPFFDYNIPVNKYDGRVGFSYSSTFAKVKSGPYKFLGLRSRSYIYSLYYSQPIVRRSDFELKGYGSLNYKRAWAASDLLKDLGWNNGVLTKDQVTSVDLGLNLRKDTRRGIWYANQDASMAVPIFDSASSYFKYSGGLLRLHDFSHGIIGQLRGNYQIIPNSKRIPYLDQFQTGGLVTVRGYSEGILMGKNGYFTSADLMFPLLPRQITSPRTGEKIPFIGNYVKGVLFADHAGVFPYVKQDVYDGSYFLASIGMGLRVQLPGDLSARLYWGYPLINNRYETDRKMGRFHFELTLEPNIDKLLKSRSVAAKVVPQVEKEVQGDIINNYPDIRHYDYFLDGGGAL